MEYYNTFIRVILKEISKFKLNTEVYSTYVSQLTAALDENFDISYNRCAYMYRYATGFTYFFNDCTKKFFANYTHTSDLFSMWQSYSEVKVCSLSVGPGLDYLAFVLAVLEYDSGPKNFDITVVSKHGAWRNTAGLILEVFSEQVSAFKVSCNKLKYQNVKVIQSDLLKDYLNNVNVIAISEANIILMMKTLNLLASGSSQEAPWLHVLKEMVSSLKPKTTIFCIDTKPSIAVFTQALSHCPGKFLYGPIHQTVQLPAVFPEVNGNHPVISVRGAFFVWQKINSPSSDLCNSPFKNMGEENKVNNLTVCNSSDKCDASSVVETTTPVENSDADNNLNLPWIELKSFWKSSSPKTKELIRRVMLTEEENLEEIYGLISQSEKLDINKKYSLETDKEISKEENELDENQIISSTPQIKMQELSEDNQKKVLENCYDLHSNNAASPSPSDTLNSVSSFSCENNSSSKSVQQNIALLPVSSETLQIYHQSGEDSMDIKENYVKLLPSENKAIQTDTLLDIPSTQSSVKVLADKIRQLAISLESASQHIGPSNMSGGYSFNFNQHSAEPDFHTHLTDKPSCSKQSPSFGCKEPHSLPSYQSYRNAPCQNMVGPCSCQCSHNRCMHCHFQPCCGQPAQRCNLSFNQQQNNMENVSSPNIVIPLQNISDNALLQIISILKSESKN